MWDASIADQLDPHHEPALANLTNMREWGNLILEQLPEGGDAGLEFAEGSIFPGEPELDALAESFGAADLQTLLEGALKPVFTAVKEGGNLVDLMDDLTTLYPDMNTDTLQELLARMIFVAEVWGRIQGANHER